MSDPFARFDGVVENLEDLRTTLREPMPSVVDKVIDHIDDVAREIIAKAPFVVVASATAGGYPDISPKGDPAGFVQVLDEMQRDLRRRTEKEIAHLQEVVFRDNDDAFFRACDADRLKRNLRLAQFKSAPTLA